jgi:hypothetical protein
LPISRRTIPSAPPGNQRHIELSHRGADVGEIHWLWCAPLHIGDLATEFVNADHASFESSSARRRKSSARNRSFFEVLAAHYIALLRAADPLIGGQSRGSARPSAPVFARPRPKADLGNARADITGEDRCDFCGSRSPLRHPRLAHPFEDSLLPCQENRVVALLAGSETLDCESRIERQSCTGLGLRLVQLAEIRERRGEEEMRQRKSPLHGKVGGAFTSSATQHGGNETTLFSIIANVMHFGMIIVGLPYRHAGQMTLDEIVGRAPYGTTAIAGGQGQPSLPSWSSTARGTRASSSPRPPQSSRHRRDEGPLPFRQ